jgi:hypothetical protein
MPSTIAPLRNASVAATRLDFRVEKRRGDAVVEHGVLRRPDHTWALILLACRPQFRTPRRIDTD